MDTTLVRESFLAPKTIGSSWDSRTSDKSSGLWKKKSVNTTREIQLPCWEIAPVRDHDIFWRFVGEVVPEAATFEVEPIHTIDLQKFLADFEMLKKMRGLDAATRTKTSVESMTVRGLANLNAIFKEYFLFLEFFDVGVYDEEKCYLSWHDAPDDPMYLYGGLSEVKVREFSGLLGVPFRRIVVWDDVRASP